jgi:3-methyladenine DNA glycosylase AlkC
VARVHPEFRARAFVRDAVDGLDDLELLDRARQVARALGRHLPPAYPDAVDVLVRSLGPEHAGDELVGAGMAPFFYLPHVIFVAENGLDHFELSMRAQHELTRRFTAEFSIRYFLDRHPGRTLEVLLGWARDPSPHVRRLASEGTRLRLPWGRRVPWLDRNPRRILEILEVLKDDPTTLVRRSVANNLNDLARVHPGLVVETCGAWLRDATPGRRALVEHALRGAVKRGDPGALDLLGYGGRPAVTFRSVRIRPRRVAIGGAVTVELTLRNAADRAQDLLVDLAVHFVKATGRTSPKVFKVARARLGPGEEVTLRKVVSLAVHTTRRPRPGRHAVDVLVNGQRRRVGTFDVVTASRPR